MLDLTVDNEFGFWVPFDIIKSSQESKAKDNKRWIEGIASTEDLDLQNEIVSLRGVDFNYFLRYGYFNNDHKPGFENKVGEPTECRVTPKGLYVKGFLFKNKKIAEDIWEMALSLESSQSSRKLGFSIQGKVLRRQGKRLLSCWVQEVAITAAPINTNTYLDIVKSLMALPEDAWCDESGCYEITPEDAYKSIGDFKKACTCKGAGCGSKDTAMAFSEEEMDLKKVADQCHCEEKALAASSPAGRALTPESLEGEGKDQGYGRTDPKYDEDDTKKSLTFNESVAYVQAYHNLPQPEAEVVARAIFEMNGIN